MDGILQKSAENRKKNLLESLFVEMSKAAEMDNKSQLNSYMFLAEKYREEISCHFAILRDAKEKLNHSGFNQVMYSVLSSVSKEELRQVADFFISDLKDSEYGRDIYRLALEKNPSPEVLVELLDSVTASLPEEELICEVMSKIIQKIKEVESVKFYSSVETALSKLKSRHCQIRFIMDLYVERRSYRDRYKISALVYNVLGDRKWALELCEMSLKNVSCHDPSFMMDAARHLYRLTGDGTMSMPPVEIYMKIMENINKEEEQS